MRYFRIYEVLQVFQVLQVNLAHLRVDFRAFFKRKHSIGCSWFLVVLRKGSWYRPGTFFNEGKKKFAVPAKPGVHPFGLGDSLIGVSSNWGSLNGGIRDGGSSIGSGPCIVKICQHLTKEVSIWKMLAYYAGILCQHLTKEVSIWKMPA